MPVIPACEKWKQEDQELKARLVYRESSKTDTAIQRNTVWKQQQQKVSSRYDRTAGLGTHNCGHLYKVRPINNPA